MEGMRRYDEWQRIRLRVPDDTVIPQIVRPLNIDELSEREKLIVPYIDGQRTIEEIALQTHNAEFNVARLVFEGLRNETMGLVQIERSARQAVAVGAGGSESEVEQFLARGKAHLKDDPQKAYRMFKVASDLDPSDGRAADAIRQAEREIKGAIAKDGITGDRIPEIAIPVSKLTELSFSPHEGFVLSRINGVWDVKSIMKISPIKELEVLMIFQSLSKQEVIRWKKK